MILTTFIVAFAFSFIGSIPPGSINLSVLQLSIDHKFPAAIRFALAAALVEYPYAYIAVIFQAYLTASPVIMNNLKLIAGLVMILLGIINLYASNHTSNQIRKLQSSGFRKGIIISILNPLAIPFWVGVTAYLSGNRWIALNSTSDILIYVAGISLGTFALLFLLAILGKKISFLFQSNTVIHSIPGIIFLLLGSYALLQYFSVLS